MFVPVDQLEGSLNRYSLWKDKSGREEVLVATEEAIIKEVGHDIPEEVVKNNILGSAENINKRKDMLKSLGTEPLDFAFERAIGKNDSVYSNFVELIAEVKRKVGRIVLKQENKNIGFATGFMVSEQLLLTNWHVFKDEDEVAESEVQFYYELDTRGNPGQPVSFQLDIKTFFHTCKELDYCLIAVKLSDVTNTVSLSSIGHIYLDPALGKLGNEGEESLNIIHHPEGDYKQLSIRENLFTKIMPTTIWYESDTAQGSSGSPVFNDQWQVVGLHHMGVPKRNERGEYIDKKGDVIPVIGNKIDTAKIHWIANEGIRISVILKDIFGKFPDVPVVSGLKKPPSPSGVSAQPVQESKLITTITKQQHMESTSQNDVRVSFPASLVETNGTVVISITNTQGSTRITEAKKPDSSGAEGEDNLLETRKIEIEDSMDYSNCRGYASKFLGIDLPLPQPKSEIKKFIARVNGTDGITLKYYHYSTIFHSVRMMPLISAINVDGDTGKRLDKTKRNDTWLRDNRLNYDIQLGDSYYRNSGFDRGHMSRREDANWGRTAEEAKRNADLTCMYTNACPQIKTLNQSKQGGLWGKLESLILEKGAIQERGKTAKISVFNGPIFNDAKDPVFRGIQVPMEFYKIIVWFNDKKQLKATAFRLSQVDLVDDIDFEAIDIDSNTEFKQYQCSIKSLERDTKIDFSALTKYDTYNKSNKGDLLELNSEEELEALIKSI